MSSKGETEADSGTVSPNLPAVKNEPVATASSKETPKRGGTLLKCTTCNSFSTLSSRALTTHMAQCSPDNNNVAAAQNADARPHRKLFECDVCNMKFSNGANMRRHKMRHTGVKPYECRVCQKRFFRKDHLAEHFTTHTKSLPYHCPICNRGFQRQIAMRAHFQNEHVGQHDLVKTCPLCSYRAPTMKSLRVHFFNRHGIDLDNPGPGNNVSFLAAGIANAAYADGTMDPVAMNALGALGTGLSVSVAPAYSDSGESNGARSVDNATPPMHYLTPHVEISMADNNETFSPGQSNHLGNSDTRMNGEGPSSPQSGDSAVASSSLSAGLPTNITPSITLIPIKQEPNTQDESGSGEVKEGEANGGDKRGVSSSLSSLIKVSPLKSLLREDLRRRISARGRARNSNASRASPSEGGVITSTHGDAAMLPSSLVCTFCAITFPDSTLYFLHKGCHCDSNPWKCNICGEQCCNVYEFNSHLLSKSHQ
ncbi:zinc finger protein ztf-16 isoform X2 [Galleria mellonella]|uniref:Zinc finger protein ztf-16 isoform X2 n=1 Tax=Galleria mellonella TaxID=7137 RepID=A0A6J1X9K4_GALME|nr:zinc finger protein ztf-16 isoform X2 [Galleria mellonella]